LLDKAEILTAAVALVSGGGVGESITDYPLTCFQSWTDHLDSVLGSVGCIEKQLG
jgi:hypothetical protein